MLIAFTGTQSTGKTTLLNRLREDKDFEGFTFIDEITRNVGKEGMKINENGTDATQIAIMNAHIANSCKDNAIMDRCALDGVVYTEWLYNEGNVTESTYKYAENIYKSLINKYDYIFYLEPEFALVDDGVRSANIEFRDMILDLFRKRIAKDHIKVTQLTGSVEERVSQLKKAIEK